MHFNCLRGVELADNDVSANLEDVFSDHFESVASSQEYSLLVWIHIGCEDGSIRVSFLRWFYLSKASCARLPLSVKELL